MADVNARFHDSRLCKTETDQGGQQHTKTLTLGLYACQRQHGTRHLMAAPSTQLNAGHLVVASDDVFCISLNQSSYHTKEPGYQSEEAIE